MIYYLSNFFIGVCVASHANLVFNRLQIGNYQLILSRSYCFACKKQLKFWDTLPIISYLYLRGKCHYCQTKISAEHPLIELIGGFSFVLLDFSKINSYFLAILLFFLLIISLFDYFEQEFPIYLLFCPLLALIGKCLLFPLKLDSLSLLNFLPMIMAFGLMIKKGKLGEGDLLIYLLLVGFFSTQSANLIMLLTCILCLVVFPITKKKSHQALPFVPYIYAATILFNNYQLFQIIN